METSWKDAGIILMGPLLPNDKIWLGDPHRVPQNGKTLYKRNAPMPYCPLYDKSPPKRVYINVVMDLSETASILSIEWSGLWSPLGPPPYNQSKPLKLSIILWLTLIQIWHSSKFYKRLNWLCEFGIHPIELILSVYRCCGLWSGLLCFLGFGSFLVQYISLGLYSCNIFTIILI